MRMRTHAGFARSERGSSLVETAVFMPVLLTLLVSVVDFGRAYYWANEVAGAAHAGAVYGSQSPTDTTGMVAVAKDNATPDIPNIAATAVYGCECSDGSGVSASCATPPTCTGTTEVYYVKVTASAAYTPMVPWPGLTNSFTLSNTVEMRSSNQ